jgi:hypothetical protein
MVALLSAARNRKRASTWGRVWTLRTAASACCAVSGGGNSSNAQANTHVPPPLPHPPTHTHLVHDAGAPPQLQQGRLVLAHQALNYRAEGAAARQQARTHVCASAEGAREALGHQGNTQRARGGSCVWWRLRVCHGPMPTCVTAGAACLSAPGRAQQHSAHAHTAQTSAHLALCRMW